MTITTTPNIIIIINGKTIYTMRRNNEYWWVEIWDKDGGFLTDMRFSDYSPRAAWKRFYHMARRDDWYKNGR